MNTVSRNPLIATLVTIVGLSTQASAQERAPLTDHQLFQGTWICTATLKDGQPVQTWVGVQAVIEGDNLTWHYPQKDGSYTSEKCKFRIDETRRHFDWWRPAKPQSIDPRCYSISRDVMHMSTNLDFKNRPEAVNSGKWQFTCRRVQGR